MEPEERPKSEFAHVLFIDLVGYSLGSVEGQARIVQELQEVVRATPEFRRAVAASDELIPVPSGDGMALAFLRDPLGPVQCAAEIGHALRSHDRLRVRMGIHSGPISRLTDIAGKINLTGAGINLAHRVMDCGDAGHILLSEASAAVVREFEAWSNCMTDLGEVEVKHGVRLHLHNLLLGEVGNPSLPGRLAEAMASAAIAATLAPVPKHPGAPPATPRGKVVFLYKRHSAPDERLLGLLGERLRGEGFVTFIDRDLHVGADWWNEIQQQIAGSDAVIVLLSEASVRSEMLEPEVETAYEAARRQGGRPRLLPVRMAWEQPLSGRLAAYLGPLQYTLWTGPEDDERVTQDLLTALISPPGTSCAPSLPVARRERAGGAVPLDSAFYIVRPTDQAFQEAIARQDSIVLVKGARQMGKTSLLARGLQMARTGGAQVVLTDFQALSNAHLTDADTLYRALAEMIADQLDLEVLPGDVWNEKRGANTNLERYLRREVLGALGDTPLVWGLDEVDRLFTCPFGSEVFGLFRSWHNRRSLDPAGPWSRLTLAIAYATEAHLFITDLNQSPFNVGTRLALDDFTREQTAELNLRYGSPLAADQVGRLQECIGGQPYLTCRALDEFYSDRAFTIDAFEAQASRDEGLFGDHLRRLLISLTQDPALTEVVRGLLQGRPCPNPESFYRLRAAGLVRGDSESEARSARTRLRCRIYDEYLARHLLVG